MIRNRSTPLPVTQSGQPLPVWGQEDPAPPDRGSLTAAEAAIWAGQRLDPGKPLYNMSLAFHVEEAIDPDLLRRAFEGVVSASDTLRTTFEFDGSRTVPVVQPHVPVPFEVVSLQGPSGAEDLGALLKGAAARPFTADGALTALTLVQRPGERSTIVLTQHHLVTDAWSMALLFRRLGEAYRNLADGHPVDLAFPLFADRRDREHGLKETPEWDRAQAFWAQSGSRTDAPGQAYGRSSSSSGRALRWPLHFTGLQREKIRGLLEVPPFKGLSEEQAGFTLFATALAAWMGRCLGRERVSIGVPFRMRSDEVARSTNGLFVELFPLELTVDPAETFEELALKVKAALMRMAAHALPGTSTAAPRSAFDVVLNYLPDMELDFGGREAVAEWVPTGFIDPAHIVRLHVHGFGKGTGARVEADLSTDVFGELEAGWFRTHLTALLDAVARDPAMAIGAPDLATWDEVASYVPATIEVERPGSVLDLFDHRVSMDPAAPAIQDSKATMSYRELDRRSRGVARGLAEKGIEEGDLVGICLQRSADLVVALLGVLRAGAAFVPLDPRAPDLRNQQILESSGICIVLGEGTDHPNHDGEGLGTGTVGWYPLSVVEYRDSTTGSEDRRPSPSVDSIAYVLHTSGSTGRPKGVEVRHGGLADYVAWAVETYAGQGPVRFPLFTSPAFDLTLTSVLVPLASGGTVVVYGEDPDEPAATTLQRVFSEGRVDVVKLTPSHLSLVNPSALEDSRAKVLVLGGEDLPRSLAERALTHLGSQGTLFNEYGPTEATIACMIHRFDPESDSGSSVPIGRPVPNVTIRIVDDQLRPVPRGVAGELCVSGPRVARGYLNLPDRNAEVFLTDPQNPAMPMYRTGDWARWTSAGVVEFLGRRDDQVKVRGARIELGEVESVLGSHPDVQACAAYVVREAESGAERCRECGLEGSHPQAQLDAQQVCAVCRRFEATRDQVATYFSTMSELEAVLDSARAEIDGPYDCLMLLSGGKDSTYALCKVVELGARPLVFMLDNGFISDQAKANAKRVVDQLGLELVLATPKGMDEIFRDSLARFSNVCEGCFKTIYTLAINLAHSRGIKTIVTGLSRGQIFETRLQDLYRRDIFDPERVEETILTARKAYHRMDDAVSRTLDVSLFETDEVLDDIRFVDFYRYCDDSLDVVLDYIGKHTPWIRPSDTGRSTNCLINEAGIYVHQHERGYHNYSMPYSWDVRLGHKRRDAAVEELDDDLDPVNISSLLGRVAYQVRPKPPRETRLAACYVSDRTIPVAELRAYMAERLPPEALPSAFIQLEAMPLGDGGKIDRSSLPRPSSDRPLLEVALVPPRDPREADLVSIWQEVLGFDDIGVHDNFFEIGGDSMHCIQIVAAAMDRGFSFQPRDLFDHPTVAELAALAPTGGDEQEPQAAGVTEEELEDLQRQFGDL